MSENPYQSSNTGSLAPTKTRTTRWLVWSGAVLLALAVSCIVLSVVFMMMTFTTVAESATTASPSGLAEGMQVALIPLFLVLPLGILGVVMVVTGLVIRKPCDLAPSDSD
jgi:heme/copper-type cytochrome/quinol oxidase subunit 2